MGEEKHDEEIAGLIDSFSRDSQWLSDHLEDLRDKYPNEYIAVKNSKVIAHNPSWEGTLQAVKRKGFETANTPIEYIPEEPEALVV